MSNKQATITGGATTITSSNLTASRVLVSNSSGKVAVSSVTSSDLTTLKGYKHIVRIANAVVDIGTIGANTSSTGTTTVTAAGSGETVYFLYRASTWCIPQSVSLSNTTLTITAINPSANSHNCSASYVLVYVK